MAVTPVFAHLDEALRGVPRVGVVHVGAHKGQEVPSYRAAGFEVIVLVEPNPARWPDLDAIHGVKVCPVACGTGNQGTLHVTKFDEQSSLLTPTNFAVRSTVDVVVRPLSDLQGGCNVAVLDVQGSELDVLRSADLSALDAVIVEQDALERYEGAGTPEQVADVLTAAGFSRRSVWPHRWETLTEEVWVQ